ncbi:hypothetical protein ACWDBC_01150 [Streptomyces parvus]
MTFYVAGGEWKDECITGIGCAYAKDPERVESVVNATLTEKSEKSMRDWGPNCGLSAFRARRGAASGVRPAGHRTPDPARRVVLRWGSCVAGDARPRAGNALEAFGWIVAVVP